MTADRETVMEALAMLVFSVADFKDTGRRVEPWNEITNMPACFLRSGDDVDEWPTSVTQKTIYEAEIWIFSEVSADPKDAPDIPLNGLILAVRNALGQVQPGMGTATLGGLVTWCRIEGRTLRDPGDGDGKSKAVIPVRILVP